MFSSFIQSGSMYAATASALLYCSLARISICSRPNCLFRLHFVNYSGLEALSSLHFGELKVIKSSTFIEMTFTSPSRSPSTYPPSAAATATALPYAPPSAPLAHTSHHGMLSLRLSIRERKKAVGSIIQSAPIWLSVSFPYPEYLQ